MHVGDIISLSLILLGAAIMTIAIFGTRKVIRLLEGNPLQKNGGFLFILCSFFWQGI